MLTKLIPLLLLASALMLVVACGVSTTNIDATINATNEESMEKEIAENVNTATIFDVSYDHSGM